VAVFAPKNPVRAPRVGLWTNGDVLALFGFHSGLPVARQASFVLL
jgi:hypothetical protein